MNRLALLVMALLVSMPGMARDLLRGAAAQLVEFGPLLDETDNTREVGLAPIAAANFIVCKDGGSCTAKNDPTAATHLSNGVYQLTLDNIDTNATSHICIINGVAGTIGFQQCFSIESSGWRSLNNGDSSLFTSEEAGLVYSGVVASFTPGVTLQIDTPSPDTNAEAYEGCIVGIKSVGTESNARTIVAYSESAGTGTITLDSPLTFTPSNPDVVRIWCSTSDLRVADAIAGQNDFDPGTATVSVGSLAAGSIDADALDATAVAEIWNEVIETSGATWTARCIMAALLAINAGEFTSAGQVRTFEDPDGIATRVVGTTAIDGTSRSSVTITCP